ncbi:MAG TPA: DUF1559 domain-containing protein [Planctomicrobium sp.]|nr:DUF1559 domain-containing protein [Planctomicrobium sp.]
MPATQLLKHDNGQFISGAERMNALLEFVAGTLLFLIFVVIPILCLFGLFVGLFDQSKRKGRIWDFIWIAVTGFLLAGIYHFNAVDYFRTRQFNHGVYLALSVTVLLILLVHLIRILRGGNGIRLRLTIGSLAGFMLILTILQPIIEFAREAARSSQCKGVKQIGLAMHNYYDMYETFPLQASGDPPHSWRIDLLPLLDKESLFKKYDQSQEWNSEQNLPIAKTVVSSWTCPSMPPPLPDALVSTAYAIPVSEHGVYSPGKPPLKMKEITGGMSHAAVLVEVCGAGIIWSEPRDVIVDPDRTTVRVLREVTDQSDQPFSSYHPAGSVVLVANGDVRRLSPKTSPEVLNALFDATSNYPDDDEF